MTVRGLKLKTHLNEGWTVVKNLKFRFFWKAAQAKFETKEIYNCADKSRLPTVFPPANRSGISISFGNWEEHFTHLNPSLCFQVGFVAAERGLLSPLHHSSIYQSCASGSKSVRTGQQYTHLAGSDTHGQKLFQTTRRAGKKRSFFFFYSCLYFRQLVEGVTLTRLCITLTPCLPVLSSNTPVEFVSRYCRLVWTLFHPCNSNRSDFYAAQLTSYTPTLKSRSLRRQGFQSGVRGPPTGQWAASRWTQDRFSSSF